MFSNYIKIAFRNLIRNSTYSFINIFGLALGISCSVLILLWVQGEVSFDRFQPKYDRLYQVWINSTNEGSIQSLRSVPLPTYDELKSNYGGIKNVAVTDWGGGHLLTVGDKRIGKQAFHVSPEFLEMFQFKLVHGSAEQALDDPSSIVISESTALALFGNEDPLNKIILLDNRDELKVTGVLKDVPKNSSFQFDFLLSFKKLENDIWVKTSTGNWDSYSFPVYVELESEKSESLVENNIREILTRKGQINPKREFFLHPLSRWHLYSNFENGKEAGGIIYYVTLFSAIAALIVVIACINFMNLSTARSERRAREVGIRKTVGSRKKDLIIQFLGESMLMTCIGFIVALFIVELSLPLYNNLTGKNLALDYTSPFFWYSGIGLVLFTGLVSGSYPAFYLSSFNPAIVLKGRSHVDKGAGAPRKMLVTFQFGLSIFLIAATIIIHQQIQFAKNRQLGYNQDNLITVYLNGEIGKHYKTIKHELLNSGVVESVNQSNSPITDIWSRTWVDWPGKPPEQKVMFSTIHTDYDFTKTYSVKILEGRDFLEDFKSDTAAVIVNKAALEIMGLKNPIGTTLEFWGEKKKLIGVVDNILLGSPFEAVEPLIIALDPTWVRVIGIRLEKPVDIQASIKKVQTIFKKYNPQFPFEYSFVDDTFEKKFSSINLIASLSNLFASLAVIISCLGLFGLAAFAAEQRTKEIGVRKVLGATITSLVILISRDFVRLVLIAFVLVSPLTWWVLSDFLERYQYRVQISLWVLPITGLAILIGTIIIVSTQAFKAATDNPIHSLRSE